MTRDMSPLPGDDYMVLCLKLQAAAKIWNKANREKADMYSRHAVCAEAEARALLDACVAAMGEPVLLGSTQADARVA